MTALPRVVSLVPSVTETLEAWGITPIACSRFCERPDLAHVGGTKDPDVDAIVALRPDLVVLDREENRREDHDALRDAGVHLEVLHVASLLDVGPEIGRLAQRVGATFEVPELDPGSDAMVTAFVPIWKRPWMTVGAATYGTTLLRHVGVDVAFADRDDSYPSLETDEVHAAEIDLVIAPSEPYPFAPRHEAELSAFGPVVFVDGRDLFWWGVRTVEAIGRLRRVLHKAVS